LITLLILPVIAFTACSKIRSLGKLFIPGSAKVTSEAGPFYTLGEQRKPPKPLPVNRPVQITFEADPVHYAAVSPSGRWLGHTSGRQGSPGLWLRSADPDHVVLPRRLTPGDGTQSAPAISSDDRWIAFVGTGYDVKGDIYLMEMNGRDAKPKRLTGRDTEDGAPCFSPDGKTLYFHQARPGQTQRHLMALSLDNPESPPFPLETGGDSAFPSVSPDGKRCAFVSVRDDPGGDIFLLHLETGRTVPLTRGPDRDLFPVWSREGQYIYFSRFALDTDRDGEVTLNDHSVIYRVQVHDQNPSAYPVTSASYSSYQPVVSTSHLYFLSTRKGVSNLWVLPLEGEIPSLDHAQGQIKLAQELEGLVPPDHHLTILGYYRVLERFPQQGLYGGRAAYAMGRLYELMTLPEMAERTFNLVCESFRSVQPEAALSRIHLIRMGALRQWREAQTDGQRQSILHKARSQLEEVISQHPDEGRIQARGRIQQARLLMELGKDSESLLEGIGLLDRVIETDSSPRKQVAEAMVLRADIYSRMGRAEALFPAYTKIVREFSDVEEWADRAVERILEMSVSDTDSAKPEDQFRLLSGVAEKYRETLPRLAMGAWNRIGDIYFAADEWKRAKEAYRQVLERFPVLGTQTAAARLALAEILYREERFRQALDLYETEMTSRPYEDYLYQLARSAHIRKSIAAGEFLLRLGEIPSARNVFINLIRQDYSIVEAHRGYIQCVASQKQIPGLLNHYRRGLGQNPNDPIALYSTGLCLTYVGGKKALKEAQSLIMKAIEHQGQVEYFHQTLGYVLEVLETVHGEKGRLEAALESYLKAHFLNNPKDNPENAAHLLLNLGNVTFLLGQYGKAFESYAKRFESKVPFEHEETEILFYRRFGAAAFQVRERERPIQAFSKALHIIDRRIQPKHASEILGRINRYIFDRIITPALGEPKFSEEAKRIADRQGELNRRLYESSGKPVGLPPDPSWQEYENTLKIIISEQESIIGDLPPLIRQDQTEVMESLGYRMGRVRDALQFPQRFMHLKAEMLDRLGLAYQEAEKWKEARETFENAYTLNKRLGILRNLTVNQRSMAFNAYQEAGTRSGQDRIRLLELSLEGFRKVIDLVRTHGVVKKEKERRKKAVISLAFDIDLDQVSSSQAMYGFSAEQEERLAEAFISRIQMELGHLGMSQEALKRQLDRYPPGSPISDKDIYGVSLLHHRAGHLAYALKDLQEAFHHFRRSAELSHGLKNPVSAAINVVNMALMLTDFSPANPKTEPCKRQFLALERKTNQLIDRFPNVFEETVIPSYHNTLGVFALSMPMEGPAGSMENAVGHMEALNRAGKHFSMGLKWFEKQLPTNHRQALAIRAALHLNMAGVASLLGETIKANEHLEAALKIARRGLLPEQEWRALAGLGRLKEALEVLEPISLLRAGCGPGEITGGFAPLVVELMNTQKTEEAFNLVERLSEIERVHRMAPMVLGRIDPDERILLRRIYPRLLTIRDLRRKVAGAKDEKRSYLSERLDQGKRVLARDIGEHREKLPFLASLAGTEAAQDWIMILLGLAVHAEDIADAVIKGGVDVETASLKKEYDELVERYVDALEEAKGTFQQGEAPGIMGLMVPDPLEAIDVMESLPEDFTCIRLFPISNHDSGWIAFTVTPEEIGVKRLDTLSHLEVSGDSPRVLVYEDPFSLPMRISEPIALSATHLIRSIQYRKPFKRAVLSIPPQYALPEPFDSRSLPASTTEAEILEGIPQVHTVLLGGTIHKAFSVASRPGQLSMPFMAMALDEGRRFPLLRLADRLSNVSLALLPGASLKDAYFIGHLFSLLGVPTVLLPRHPQRKSPFVEPFMRAYATSSAREAVQTGRSHTHRDEDWVQLGYWGMTEEEANSFASKNFARYVQTGVKAFKTNRHQQALTLFENALNVAAETDALRRYKTDLHRYARESAYAAGHLDKAIQHARALADILAEREPDTEAHAKALLKLGLVQARAEKYDHAIPVLEEAVEIMKNLELGPEQVAALSNLGVVLENATEYDRALVKFQSAASLSRSLNKNELLARQYMSIGRIYDLRLSQYARARQSYGEAYSIYRELAQKDRMAQALLDMGRCYRLMGNFKEADGHYRRALELLETDKGQLRLKAKIMIEQANNGWYQARYQEAFNLQREVYNLARQNQWHLEQVIALNTSGLTWWTLGDNQRALRELEDALALANTLRVRRDEVATTLNNMGLVYREMGLFEKALEVLNKALIIDREINSRWAIAYDLRNMALTYLRMGDPEEAVKLFQEGLVVASDIGNRINEAKILLGLGEALFTLNRYQEAQTSFKKALELSRSMVLRETEWRALYGMARLLMKEGRNPEARDLLVQATTVIDGMRAEIRINQLKDGFINNKMAVYETLVSVLVDLGEQWKAFDVAERSRARNLIDLLGNQRLDLHGAIDQEMYDRQNTLRSRIQEHEELLAQAQDEGERSVYGPALKRLRDQYGDLMLEIQAKNPELASLVSVNPLTLTKVRELLEPGVGLLAFYVVPEEVFCWLIRPESVELFRTPIGRKTLDQSILTYRRIIQNLEPFDVQSKELYSWLLSPVMPKLEDIRVLGIVPHGSLHYLSFATLYDGDTYVGERFPLFYLPSASVLRYTLNRRTDSKNVRVLAIGNPDLKDPALDLPFAEREVATIGFNFPEITVLTKEKARESWVVRHIHEFGIIHMASHGEFNPINPLFSAVKLVKDSHADGDLEASEVFGLRINADLVVLSACQTGLGKVTSGDDVIGMNRSFLYGGSHAILSSLWRVNDISTAILVKQFYRRYVAEKKAESLRRAMLHVKNRYPHPGYWGAFVLTGDYY